MSRQATAPATPDAPTILVGRSGAEVVIRYDYAGTGGDLRLPLVIWVGLAKVTTAGRLATLGEEWTAWSSSGGRSRRDGGEVVHGYGYLHQREARLPAPVWRALSAAIHAGTLDQLPALDAQELAVRAVEQIPLITASATGA
ncbi:hypothetical protein E0F15_14655 [Frankia sp. B2]|uniref:hypothetical protein n=1 Tax=unclassified Frankia TaxID=2632575 RepID=UPI0003CFA75C|nr:MULTISPECIES: hypothetical protein [unclassified Frankia]ETA02422.1 hypothetical protein CcI6DRAFT_02217 [Frankia sp. CcI6]KFB04710.1 hypothetical protein ALLO2DRAFT_02431 [Frankia sp. Allo2]OFB44680.1 hypothetical protein Manayef4_07435 [Frankia sp. CgIM4]OHV55086.1 hypothetical protein CgIS1_11080 [Frankia sp. CgIS1]ORT51613.1 hypothetical protein KBI5_10915 [Frankia sp. KB5]